MSEPPVVVEGAAKFYGKTAVVNPIDLTLRRGSVCGLVGPNGAGKTTTLGMFMGLIKPSQGRLRVLGFNPATDSFAVRQRTGFVPEHHHIYPFMRVRQVLSFCAAAYPGWNWDECRRLTDVLGLPTTRRVKELSRGELAKLALAIALSHQPQLLLLDEPTSGLDPLIRRQFLDTIRQLIHTRDCTVLFSTHILSDVERIADHIVVMNQGRVVANDTVEHLRGRFIRASFLFDRVMDGIDVQIPRALRVEKAMREWVVIFPTMSASDVREIARAAGAMDCLIQPASLDDVFVELISSGNGAGAS